MATWVINSWTGVTLDGSAYTLNWSDLANRPLMPYMEALRLAFVERMNRIAETVPSSLSTAFTSGRLPTAQQISDFQTKMTAMLNATTSNDYYEPSQFESSMATLPATQTEAAALSAIGAASRIAAPGIPTAEWAEQQYLLLNQLRHTLVAGSGTTASMRATDRKRWGSGAYDWTPISVGTDTIGSADYSTYQERVRGYQYVNGPDVEPSRHYCMVLAQAEGAFDDQGNTDYYGTALSENDWFIADVDDFAGAPPFTGAYYNNIDTAPANSPNLGWKAAASSNVYTRNDQFDFKTW